MKAQQIMTENMTRRAEIARLSDKNCVPSIEKGGLPI